jgi:hypothetical protein
MRRKKKVGGRQHRADARFRKSRRHAVETEIEAGGVVVTPSSSDTASKTDRDKNLLHSYHPFQSEIN